MVASMTAFARAGEHAAWGQAIWEIRSVNHRYLEMSFKIPDNFRQWEAAWRQSVARFVKRGKIECHLIFTAGCQTAPRLDVNEALVAQLLLQCQKITKSPGVESHIKAIDILRWPEVLISKTLDFSELEQPVSALLEKALRDLGETRNREGKQLQQLLLNKLEQTKHLVSSIRTVLPQALHLYREKLNAKLQALHLNVDPQRLEQEVVLFVQKSDIDEELDRLNAHMNEVEKFLNEGEAMGRRLDFLMQELNREANTLAAKALDHTISEKAVALKVLIEQMREQIQNVE